MTPATSHRTRRCSCPEPDRREEPHIYLRLTRVQLAKGRRQVDQANAVTSAGSPEHLPRVAEVGTGVPRQEQPQRPPTSASLQIPMDFRWSLIEIYPSSFSRWRPL